MKTCFMLCWMVGSSCFSTVIGQSAMHPFKVGDVKKFTQMAPLRSTAIKPFLYTPSTLASGPDFVFSCSCEQNCSTLPVSLLSFDARRTSYEQVFLKWETTNEISNKGFEIEVAYGTTEQFNYAGFVAAQVNSSYKKKYETIDGNDFSGTSYYRLKQVDLDGRYVYSNTVLVKGYDAGSRLSVYPNPASAILYANIHSGEQEAADLYVLNAVMQVISRQAIRLQKGANLVKLPVNALSNGTYFLQVVSPANRVTKSFVKF